MKNKRVLIGCAALIAAIVIVLGGCIHDEEIPPQRKILIYDIPATHNGRTVNLSVTQLSLSIALDKAAGEAPISGGVAIVALKDPSTDEPFTGDGLIGLELTITGGGADDVSYISGLNLKLITGETTSVSFEKDLSEVQPPANPVQKKITITNIPASANGVTTSGKSIKLELLKNDTVQADATATISGTSITLPLMTPNSSTAFTATGLYTVIFTLDNNTQVHYERFLPRSITAETTTMSWGDFRLTATASN